MIFIDHAGTNGSAMGFGVLFVILTTLGKLYSGQVSLFQHLQHLQRCVIIAAIKKIGTMHIFSEMGATKCDLSNICCLSVDICVGNPASGEIEREEVEG